MKFYTFAVWLLLYSVIKAIRISQSHPLWVRGLKRVPARNRCESVKSHPLWVRGLKPR